MAEEDSWDTEAFEPDEPTKKEAVQDKWDGEDEDEDVKDNWDDEEHGLKAGEQKSDKKLNDKVKGNLHLERKKQEELVGKSEESQDSTELTQEEEPGEQHEETDVELANTASVVSNNLTGIDAINPSSRDDFTEFEKLLKDKISPYETSIHFPGFLESLFRDLCLSLEADDLKKINSSITVLLSEKQKQDKQQNKGKKKKKGVVPAGGLKAKMKDDLADYGGFEGGYTQDYEDFI